MVQFALGLLIGLVAGACIGLVVIAMLVVAIEGGEGL